MTRTTSNLIAQEITMSNLKVGDRLLYRYGKGNPSNRTEHIRGFVDGRVVVRVWSYRWKSWIYKVRERYEIEILYKKGNVKVRKSKCTST